jgi:hypothetical protein
MQEYKDTRVQRCKGGGRKGARMRGRSASPFGAPRDLVAHDGDAVDRAAGSKVRAQLLGRGFVVHLAHVSAQGGGGVAGRRGTVSGGRRAGEQESRRAGRGVAAHVLCTYDHSH